MPNTLYVPERSNLTTNGSADRGYRGTGRCRLPGFLRVLLLQARENNPGIRLPLLPAVQNRLRLSAPRESGKNIPGSRISGPSQTKHLLPSRRNQATSTASPSAAAAIPVATRSLPISSNCSAQQRPRSISGIPAARAGMIRRLPISLSKTGWPSARLRSLQRTRPCGSAGCMTRHRTPRLQSSNGSAARSISMPRQ